MPRFKEADKASIREKLLSEGKKLFQRYGLRKTNVAELARAAGIAKGTFYHFFESKEDLCMAIFDLEEDEMVEEIDHIIARGKDAADTLQGFIAFAMDFVKSDSLLVRLRETGNISLLERGVRPEKLAAHLSHDVGTAEKIMAALRAQGADVSLPAEVLAGIFRSLVLLALQPQIIGEDVFAPVMANITSWITQGLIQGDND